MTIDDPTTARATTPPPEMRRWRRLGTPIGVLCVAVVFAGLIVVFTRSGGDPAADTRWMNRPAPALTGELDDGDTFDLTRRQGSWVVLNFFDVTCVPCVEEHPQLVEFATRQQSRGTGVELYSVIWGREPGRSRDFLRDNGADWPIVMDDGTIAVQLGITKVPETWIIDPNGYVRTRLIGAITADTLDQQLATLTQPPAPPNPS